MKNILIALVALVTLTACETDPTIVEVPVLTKPDTVMVPSKPDTVQLPAPVPYPNILIASAGGRGDMMPVMGSIPYGAEPAFNHFWQIPERPFNTAVRTDFGARETLGYYFFAEGTPGDGLDIEVHMVARSEDNTWPLGLDQDFRLIGSLSLIRFECYEFQGEIICNQVTTEIPINQTGSSTNDMTRFHLGRHNVDIIFFEGVVYREAYCHRLGDMYAMTRGLSVDGLTQQTGPQINLSCGVTGTAQNLALNDSTESKPLSEVVRGRAQKRIDELIRERMGR